MSANDALLAESAVELRRRIGTKEISPVELLEICIERIGHLNPAVNAITATCYERARKEAQAAEKAVLRGDQLGLLHGLPTGIKDLEDTGGLLTTYGSQLFRDFVPERDSAMVARVRAAGAIVVAKTNVPEFGAGANSRNVVWGATGNPFNPLLNAGGSSGGSAVALACDMGGRPPDDLHNVYGLTHANPVYRLQVAPRTIADGSDRICAVPDIAIDLGFSEFVVYLAKELVDQCRQDIVRQHEQEHVNTWKSQLRASAQLLTTVLRRDIGEVRYYTSREETEAGVRAWAAEVAAPWLKRAIDSVIAAQRAIDTPVSYGSVTSRLRNCGQRIQGGSR